MKKKLLWLLLLVPAIFIAANYPFTSDIETSDGESDCVDCGEVHQNWDGNSGCGYFFDFSWTFTGNCTLVDLDLTTPDVQNYFSDEEAWIWTTGEDGVIKMQPKPGYTDPGFYYSCDIEVHFEGDIVEYTLWTCFVDDYPGPYPPACY